MVRHKYPSSLLERHKTSSVDPNSGGGRSEFQRDLDRIMYSSAFRALALKTQVVAVAELGFMHNRLTHSIKVGQLGRSMAGRLRAGGAGIDPALVEAACLAHDIGHPPFGHAGEEALNLAVERLRKADAGATPIDGFEGNAQNLRVLTRLATHRMWTEDGLHLTRGTLAAATKYPWTRGADGKRAKKWGAYEGDRETLAWVLVDQPSDGTRPVETVLMDWADDVTYAVHDVDDFVRLGLIPLDRLFAFVLSPDHPQASREESPTLAAFLDWLERTGQSPGGRPLDRQHLVRQLHYLADKISLSEPYDGSRRSKGLLQATVTDLISFFVDSVHIEGAGVGYDGTLIVPEDRRILCDVLKALIWHYVIDSPGLAAQQHGQARIIDALVTWIHASPDKLLPVDRREEYDQHNDLIRSVADHVASLTEPMALSLYRKLSGTDLGSITDTM